MLLRRRTDGFFGSDLTVRNILPLAALAALALASGCSQDSAFSSHSHSTLGYFADIFRAPYDNELLRAETLMREGKTQEATALFAKTIPRIPPDSKLELADSLVKLGDCYATQSKLREAYTSYQKALDADGNNLDAHLRLAQFLSVGGQSEQAAEHAGFVLKHRPDDVTALSVLGTSEAQLGHKDRAKELLEKALDQSAATDEHRPMVAIELAQLYVEESHPDAARRVLTASATTAVNAKQGAMAWLALGRLEEQEGNKDAADAAYHSAVRQDDEVITNFRLAQFLQRTSRVAEAEQILRHVDAMRPSEPSALAEARLNAGRNEDALTLIQVNSPGAAARAIEGRLGRDDSQNSLTRYRNVLDAASVEVMEAELALTQGDITAAETHAESALKKAPNSAAAHYIRGEVFDRQERVAEAKEQWDSALESDPDYVPAKIELARQNLRENDLPTAEQHISAVVRDEPANLEALCVFARILLQEGRVEPAIAIAKRAQAVNPSAAEPHVVTGIIGLRTKRYGAAFLEFERAVLLSPNSPEAMSGILEVYRHGQVTPEVLAKMERVAISPPVSPSLLEVAGRLYAAKGMYNEAERALKRAIAADPKRQTASLALAELEYARGERKPEVFLQELAKSSGHAFTRAIQTLQAIEAERNGETSRAISSYELAITAGESSGVAANNLAWQYAQQGVQLDRALQLARSALERDPKNPAILDTLGVVQLKRRDYSGAVSVLEKATRMMAGAEWRSQSAEVYRHLAEACDGAGLSERATLARNRADDIEKLYKDSAR